MARFAILPLCVFYHGHGSMSRCPVRTSVHFTLYMLTELLLFEIFRVDPIPKIDT